MKRTLLVFGGFLFCSWACIQLWLAGYQSGYEEGSVTAWHQAHEVLRPNDVDLGMKIDDNAMKLNWHSGQTPTHLVENSD
jgi:hypothetical protein